MADRPQAALLDMSAGNPTTASCLKALALAAVLLLALQLLHAAYTLRIEYYDGYAYLSNARRLLGESWAFYHPARPPLLPTLMMPAVALARLAGPASE